LPETSEKDIEAVESDLVSKKEITNEHGDSNAWKSITGLVVTGTNVDFSLHFLIPRSNNRNG
jgi:hypothetical protein